MRRHRAVLCLACVLFILAAVPCTFAHDFQRENQHPLRYMAYPFHAVGVFAEYTVYRPIHWLVSQPYYDAIFGHQGAPEDDYWTWRVGP